MAYIDKISVNGSERDLRDAGAARFDETQSLTDVQKQAARANVGAASAADVTALTGRVTTAEGDIDALETAVDTKADAADVMALAAVVDGKVDKQQGTSYAGKALVVGADGNVTLGDAGIPDAVAEALLACFKKVAWIDTNGYELYTALAEALNWNINTYSLSRAQYVLGGINFPWVTNSYTGFAGYLLEANNTLNTRARIKQPFPCTGGTISAKEGYNIVVYEIPSIEFEAGVSPEVRAGYIHSTVAGLVVPWVTSYAITGSNTQYIWFAVKKTNDETFTQAELDNLYELVIVDGLTPKLDLFADAVYTNGKTYAPAYRQVDNLYIPLPTTYTARCISSAIPVTKGTVRVTDATKYMLSVYQLDSAGGIIQDTQNPHLDNGDPAWAEEYTLYKSEISVICISFKKLDNTDFTTDEIENMYGSVFTYEGVE